MATVAAECEQFGSECTLSRRFHRGPKVDHRGISHRHQHAHKTEDCTPPPLYNAMGGVRCSCFQVELRIPVDTEIFQKGLHFWTWRIIAALITDPVEAARKSQCVLPHLNFSVCRRDKPDEWGNSARSNAALAAKVRRDTRREGGERKGWKREGGTRRARGRG